MLVAAFFIVGACLAYNFQSTLIPLLLDPLKGEKLVYLNPAGGFSFIFMVSIYAGIALAFPVMLHQIYAFVRPTLPKAAQRKSVIIIVSSVLLLIAGILFGYLVAVPNALNFLYSFADQYVEASLTAESYLNFIIAYTIGIGIVFQLPLLLLLIHTIRPFTPGGLMKSEKWVLLIAFIIAAIITPTPDPINQSIIAGPVVLIYQIGVIAVIASIIRNRRALKKAEKRLQAEERAKLAEAKRAARPAPVLSAAPLALEEDPLPDHSPILGTALSLENSPQIDEGTVPILQEFSKKRALDGVVSAPRHATPQTPTEHLPQPQHFSNPGQKTMDGVIIRRQSPQLQVPQRPEAQPLKPPVRPAQPQPQNPQKGFYVDGIIAPRQAIIS